jgi:hypothetical protein
MNHFPQSESHQPIFASNLAVSAAHASTDEVFGKDSRLVDVIIGVFDQNGSESIKPGAKVKLAFANRPGELHESTITYLFQGTGEGQVAVSGTLARPEMIGTVKAYAAYL